MLSVWAGVQVMLSRRGDKEDRDKLAKQRAAERRARALQQQEDLKNGLVEKMAYRGASVGTALGSIQSRLGETCRGRCIKRASDLMLEEFQMQCFAFGSQQASVSELSHLLGHTEQQMRGWFQRCFLNQSDAQNHVYNYMQA